MATLFFTWFTGCGDMDIPIKGSKTLSVNVSFVGLNVDINCDSSKGHAAACCTYVMYPTLSQSVL